jgi:guanylate kinase
MPMPHSGLLIGLVGPCGSGKSTLANLLAQLGYQVRHIAQEHSFAPSMWQRLTNPDVLIFLDASYAETKRRRWLNWNEDEYAEQHRRLAHARKHAQLYIFTDSLMPDEVLQVVLRFLQDRSMAAE